MFETTEAWEKTVTSWVGIRDTPARENRKHPEGIRVMRRDFMEKYITTSHWLTPGLVFVPIIAILTHAALVWQGLAWPLVVGLMGLGVVVWTFVEYCLHRFIFHLPPINIRPVRVLLFLLHGYHHEFPSDHSRLVAPPIMGWPIAIVLTLLFWKAFGIYWQALLAGTFIGYLAYDWVHYYTHHGRPKNRFGKFMRRFHMEHHFKDASTQYGLSSPLWDFAFRTYRKPTPPTRIELECLAGESELDDGIPAGGLSGSAR